jgi:hypothetical protein
MKLYSIRWTSENERLVPTDGFRPPIARIPLVLTKPLIQHPSQTGEWRLKCQAGADECSHARPFVAFYPLHDRRG